MNDTPKTIKVRTAAGCRARAARHRETATERDAAGKPAHARMRRAAADRLDAEAERIEARERATGKPHGLTIGGPPYANGLIVPIPDGAVALSTATELRDGVEY